MYAYAVNSPVKFIDPSGLDTLRYDVPGFSTLHGYIGFLDDNGIVSFPGLINCAGYATGSGIAIQPWAGDSMSGMFGKLGYHCRPVKKSCECKCPGSSQSTSHGLFK